MFTYAVYLIITQRRKPKDQKFFFIFLFFTILNEFIFVKWLSYIFVERVFIYMIFCYLYFWYFYLKILKNYSFFVSIIVIILAGISIYNQLQNGFDSINIFSLINLSVFYIVISITYFVYVIYHVDTIKITDKLSFWITTGNLFWAVFFIFRVAPMNYFNNWDTIFLKNIELIFTFVNITTYLLFFRGLFCKQ